MANFFQRLFGSSSEPTANQVEHAQPSAPQPSTDDVLANASHMMLLMEVMRQAKLYGDADTVQAVNNMTYDGPLPEQQPDGSYSRIYELQDYNIAGINYRENIAAYLGDFEGYLKPDPDNEHDPNAIAVYAEDGNHLGYIPADETDDVRSLRLRFPIPVSVYIEECYDDDGRRFFVGEATIKVQSKNKKI